MVPSGAVAPTATAAATALAVAAATLPAAATNPPTNAVDPSAAAADAAIAAGPAVVAASGEGNDRATLVPTPPAADPVAAATSASSDTPAAADPPPTDSLAQADPAVAPPTAVRATRHARTPAPRHNSCSAGRVLPDSSATSIWLLLEDAATCLGVPYQSDRRIMDKRRLRNNDS